MTTEPLRQETLGNAATPPCPTPCGISLLSSTLQKLRGFVFPVEVTSTVQRGVPQIGTLCLKHTAPQMQVILSLPQGDFVRAKPTQCWLAFSCLPAERSPDVPDSRLQTSTEIWQLTISSERRMALLALSILLCTCIALSQVPPSWVFSLFPAPSPLWRQVYCGHSKRLNHRAVYLHLPRL